MTDLRKISGSPLEIGADATMDQLSEAMKQRHEMINALTDFSTRRISGKPLTAEMGREIGNVMNLLNNEIDAMEKILVEH